MPPIPKQKHSGGNYSLQRPLPADHAMSKNSMPTQGGGRAGPNLSVATTSNAHMCMLGTPLLVNHKASDDARAGAHHETKV